MYGGRSQILARTEKLGQRTTSTKGDTAIKGITKGTEAFTPKKNIREGPDRNGTSPARTKPETWQKRLKRYLRTRRRAADWLRNILGKGNPPSSSGEGNPRHLRMCNSSGKQQASPSQH